jgi:hypothetical protein
VDSAGDLFIADGVRVRELNHVTGLITTVAGGGNQNLGDGGPATAAQLANLSPQGYGIAVDAAGQLFIADISNDRIREVANAPTTVTVTDAASKVVFTTQPVNTAAGASITPAVQVSVEDASGNVVTSDTSNVTVAWAAR